jgi:hypothetical protein
MKGKEIKIGKHDATGSSISEEEGNVRKDIKH